VNELKRAFLSMPIAINGGLADFAAMDAQLATLDGVMVGRAAYHDPGLLLQVDPYLFGCAAPAADAFAAVDAYEAYVARQLAQGVRLADITRHMLGLFAGMPGARLWRRHLATEAVKRGAGLEVLRDALAHLRRDDVRRDDAQPADEAAA